MLSPSPLASASNLLIEMGFNATNLPLFSRQFFANFFVDSKIDITF